MQILLSDGHLMTFNKIIRITEHPTRADTSAPTEGRISLLICINWALQNYFYEGVLPRSGCHGHPQGAPHHATPPLSLRKTTHNIGHPIGGGTVPAIFLGDRFYNHRSS